MEAITVFTANAEEGRILRAFLKALKMRYKPTSEKALQELEATLRPAQLAWWLELKANLIALKKGEETEGVDAFEFLKEIEQENLATA
jgi:hypothetical protein